jgi:import inner membrane translocase subunit TIM16
MFVMLQRYEKMFAQNDPAKGGSFYLQSKVYRAHEALLRDLDGMGEKEEERESGGTEGPAAAAAGREAAASAGSQGPGRASGRRR